MGAFTRAFHSAKEFGSSQGSPRHHVREHIWALRDVSFQVHPGEVVGVIGRNGAGKSTLLKILARITEPTEGFADIQGRIGSLLEVGTGFHPELSGRENIFLNGAILGMKRVEIERNFDAIVAFAEIEKFIDTAVKHYSSGMYMRLAFAVAAHLQPEILLVDEVLAVGDVAFQKKCLGKMEEVARAGRTVLFVSHNMSAVSGLCTRAIWIDGGQVRSDGEVGETTQAYLNSMTSGHVTLENPRYGFSIKRVAIHNGKGNTSAHFAPGDDLVVELYYDSSKVIRNPYAVLFVRSLAGPCFVANSLLDGHRPSTLEGEGVLRCRFRSLPLLPQTYTVTLALKSELREAIIDHTEIASFSVSGDLQSRGFHGEYKGYASKSFPVMIPYEWTLPDGAVRSVDLASMPGSNSNLDE
jgi:lipopolysaccharide transport system ATP-binding protein